VAAHTVIPVPADATVSASFSQRQKKPRTFYDPSAAATLQRDQQQPAALSQRSSFGSVGVDARVHAADTAIDIVLDYYNPDGRAEYILLWPVFQNALAKTWTVHQRCRVFYVDENTWYQGRIVAPEQTPTSPWSCLTVRFDQVDDAESR